MLADLKGSLLRKKILRERLDFLISPIVGGSRKKIVIACNIFEDFFSNKSVFTGGIKLL